MLRLVPRAPGHLRAHGPPALPCRPNCVQCVRPARAAEQNIITDEPEYSGGTSGGMPRIPSTAATAAAAAAAAGAAGDAQVAGWAEAEAANGQGEDGEPPHKRQKKGLSVHFAEGADLEQSQQAGGTDGQQEQQQQEQQQPPGG